MKSNRSLLALVLAAILLAGCFGKPTAPAQPASLESVGSGQHKAFVVGVYQDLVVEDGQYCAVSDWRVQFTTTYSKVNGTYVYDTKDAQEFSVANDTALLAKLNETMRGEEPVFLAWHTLSNRGCEYQHREIVTRVLPLANESASVTTGA